MREFATGNPPKSRTSYRVLGVSQPTVFGVHNNNLDNLRRGIAERVMAVEGPDGLVPPPEAVAGSYSDCYMTTFQDEVARLVGRQFPASYGEFLASYKGDRRLRVYTAAVESLKYSAANRSDAYLTTFVKCEKINFSAKTDPAPRVIQPRTPRYNAEVGRYLKPLEKKVFKAIETIFGGPTVMKGYNASETAGHLRAMWSEFHDPVAVGLDASRFDQHTGEAALRWEHKVYAACFTKGEGQKLLRLLEWQIDNEGCGRAVDGRIKYKIKGCRMSGDMNTSLGNCLIMCALIWKLLQTLGFAARLANNGDDCVVIMERRDLSRFTAAVRGFFLDHGYTMKVEPAVDVFEHIEFCQTKPILTEQGWLMCRNALVAMAKDSTSVLPLEQGRMRQGWCTAIGECGMSLAGGVPVFQEFYLALLRAGQGIHLGDHPALESGFKRLSSGMHRSKIQVTDLVRVSYWKAFGIMPSVQVAIEQELSAWEYGTQPVHRWEYPIPDRTLLFTELH